MLNPFQNISDRSKEKLYSALEITKHSFKKGELILAKINHKNMIGIVIEGILQIIKVDYNGNKTIIEELEKDDLFGNSISPLQNDEYELLVKEDCLLYIMDYEQIINLPLNDKEYYHQFIKNLLEIITEKIILKNERIEILTKKTIRNKLLEYFNIESQKIGSRTFYLTFNFTDLADYLAIDRSAMSRELKNLKEEGFIEIKGKRIKLLYDKI